MYATVLNNAGIIIEKKSIPDILKNGKINTLTLISLSLEHGLEPVRLFTLR